MKEWIKFSSPTDPEMEERLNKQEKELQEYLSTYTPNLTDMGFVGDKIEEPEKWQPTGEFQEEQRLVRQAEFKVNEMTENAIDDRGNIKSGGRIFRDLFYEKISLIAGKEFADNCRDLNWYIPWMESEMQSDLCKFINDSTNKKDIEKIIAIKFIDDLVWDSIDDDGEIHVDSFVKNSLIHRFKDVNVSVLEKNYIKYAIYEILELEDPLLDNMFRRAVKEKFEDEEKLFLGKTIGDKYNPEIYHNKSFDKFEFSFSKNQEKVIYDRFYGYWTEKIKPFNYYKDKKIPASHYGAPLDFEGYITSNIAPDILGIFSKNGFLVGWKKIEDLKKESVNTINDVFYFKKGNNISLEELALFKVSSSLGFRDDIQKILNIDLSKLNIENQFYFLNFIQGKTEKELGGFKEFIKKSKNEKEKIDKLRTFLSIEQGGKEMGDKILMLGEKLPESSASVLFKTYGEMIDATDEVENILRDSLKEEVKSEIINEAKESLLVNAKNLLEKYVDSVSSCEGQTCIDIGKELEERLSLAKKSIFAFSSACKVLTEQGDFSFEDFKKAKLAYDRSPLADKMREEIIKMHQENTKQYPEKLRELWRGTLRDGLEKENPNQLVVSVSYEDEVVSAMRVIEREDGSWYGASFNVNPTIQGGRIGSELLKEVLRDLAKDKPFVADCYSKNPMLETYLNKFGFKITKEIENYHDTGELVYEITIFPEMNKEN